MGNKREGKRANTKRQTGGLEAWEDSEKGKKK